MDLVEITARMYRIRVEYHPPAVYSPLHWCQVSMALNSLTDVVNAMACIIVDLARSWTGLTGQAARRSNPIVGNRKLTDMVLPVGAIR